MTPAAGLARLRARADSGGLDDLCERHGIRVLTVFGSAAHGAGSPRDLDIAVLRIPGHRGSLLELIDDLQLAAGTDIDLAVLEHTGPVLRERALVQAIPLYESTAGAWINAATQAVVERMDTEWLRRLDLERLANR